MPVDHELRKEMMHTYTDKKLKHKQIKYRRKVLLWEFIVKFSYFLKRFLDIILSMSFLIIFSPLFLITALAIVIENYGPFFYSQVRVGKDGKSFDFYKFRSMYVGAEDFKDQLMNENESKDGVIFKIKQDPRITKVGRFLRRFSIDELPQLINVLKGDMSLVGPRPPLPREVNEYTLEDRKRLHTIPGITGIWQISGRSDIPFREQVELDKQYIGSQSVFKDIIILLKTIPAVITGKGAY